MIEIKTSVPLNFKRTEVLRKKLAKAGAEAEAVAGAGAGAGAPAGAGAVAGAEAVAEAEAGAVAVARAEAKAVAGAEAVAVARAGAGARAVARAVAFQLRHSGTALIEISASGVTSRISIASVSVTDGTATGNLQSFGFEVPETAN